MCSASHFVSLSHSHTHRHKVFLIFMQVEDGRCSIMLMSIYAVQSLASVAGRQAEDGKSRENVERRGKRVH